MSRSGPCSFAEIAKYRPAGPAPMHTIFMDDLRGCGGGLSGRRQRRGGGGGPRQTPSGSPRAIVTGGLRDGKPSGGGPSQIGPSGGGPSQIGPSEGGPSQI